jgi:uncharacterized protein YbjQ (UPF0145 family)
MDPASVFVVTTENIPGYKVDQCFGEVFGIASRSRNIGSQIGAGFKSLAGGRIGAYEKLSAETRDTAMADLRAKTAAMGANAVVMMRFDTEAIAENIGVTVAYGTAVLVSPK